MKDDSSLLFVRVIVPKATSATILRFFHSAAKKLGTVTALRPQVERSTVKHRKVASEREGTPVAAIRVKMTAGALSMTTNYRSFVNVLTNVLVNFAKTAILTRSVHPNTVKMVEHA